jgi:hypothetical protein
MTELDQAIILYTGWKISSYPQENESRILDQFGELKGEVLIGEVREIVSELKRIQPDWERHDLTGASKWAVAELASRHIGLNDEAKSALEWLYSWWWK